MIIVDDIYLSKVKPAKGFVFGLVAANRPLQIRYIGSTDDPVRRLSGLVSGPSNRRLKKWISSLKANRMEVGMRLLGEYDLDKLTEAQARWARFWGTYCNLLNCHRRLTVPDRRVQQLKVITP